MKDRIIKFRIWIPEAKIPYEGDMYYQNDQYLSSFLRRVYDQFQTTHPSYLPFQVEERLMQFTGLLDKNGKEIYEGDIIRVKNDIGQFANLKVLWRDDLAAFVSQGEEETKGIPMAWARLRYLDKLKDSEVIGNIYENPEYSLPTIQRGRQGGTE